MKKQITRSRSLSAPSAFGHSGLNIRNDSLEQPGDSAATYSISGGCVDELCPGSFQNVTTGLSPSLETQRVKPWTTAIVLATDQTEEQSVPYHSKRTVLSLATTRDIRRIELQPRL